MERPVKIHQRQTPKMETMKVQISVSVPQNLQTLTKFWQHHHIQSQIQVKQLLFNRTVLDNQKLIFTATDDWFNDQFDDLLFGDIDMLTRDDDAVNWVDHPSDDQDVTQSNHAHVFNPLGSWDSDEGIKIKYDPSQFDVV